MFHLDPLNHTMFSPELFQPEMPLPTGKKILHLLPIILLLLFLKFDFFIHSFMKSVSYLERKW